MKHNLLKTGFALLLAAALCVVGFGGAALADGEATATFYMNDGTDAVYMTASFTDGGRVTEPEAPVSESGAAFAGWYADPECTEEYNFVARQNGDQEIYARWSSGYYFEAEFTQLVDREIDGSTDGSGYLYGSGYSNEPKGLQLIVSDAERDAGSHNGYYLHDLYRNGLYIEFLIESDQDVSDAVLTLRLAGEYYDSTLTSDNFYVSVRPEGADPYDEDVTTYFEFDPIEFTMEKSGDYGSFTQFEDYVVTSEMPLVKGGNIVRLEIANTEHHGAGGTVNATAPMIDCIVIDTNAALTWAPIESNIE